MCSTLITLPDSPVLPPAFADRFPAAAYSLLTRDNEARDILQRLQLAVGAKARSDAGARLLAAFAQKPSVRPDDPSRGLIGVWLVAPNGNLIRTLPSYADADLLGALAQAKRTRTQPCPDCQETTSYQLIDHNYHDYGSVEAPEWVWRRLELCPNCLSCVLISEDTHSASSPFLTDL